MSEQTPKYLIFDKRPTLGTLEVPGESWDAYVVRKLTEEREYKVSILTKNATQQSNNP